MAQPAKTRAAQRMARLRARGGAAKVGPTPERLQHEPFVSRDRLVELDRTAEWIGYNDTAVEAAVYIVAAGKRGPCKIGWSIDPHGRAKTLNTWRALQIHDLFWFSSQKDAYEVEQHAHRLLRRSGRQLRGEWYSLTPKQSVRAVENALSFSDVQLASRGLVA